MDWKDLAPWIAISITLAISILVPLFTQIANNSHQRKMQQEKLEYEQNQKKIIAYEEFLITVGAAVMYSDKNTLPLAGSNIERIYLYAPKEWHEDLDSLFEFVRKCEWENASLIMQGLNRLISEELNKKNISLSKQGGIYGIWNLFKLRKNIASNSRKRNKTNDQ